MWVPCIVLGCSAYLNMGFLSYLPWSVSYLVFTLYILYSVLNVSIFINSWDIFLGLSLICSSLYIYSLLCVECFNLYINLAFLFVCLYPINVKTAEPIRPKFCVGPHVVPGKVYEWSYEYGIPVIYSLVFLLSGLTLYIFSTLWFQCIFHF